MCEKFFCSLTFSFVAFKMFDEEKASNRYPRNIKFVLKAMQQQFDCFNFFFGKMMDRMDRQDTVIANFHRGPPNGS